MFSFLQDFIQKRRQKREMEKKGLIGSRKRRTQESTLGHTADRSKLLGIVILTLVWFSCIGVLVIPSPPKASSGLVIGQRAPKSIFASFDFSYDDTSLTERNRQKAQERVPLFFRIDQNITDQSLSRANELLSEIARRREQEKKGEAYLAKPDSKLGKIVEQLDPKVLADLIQVVWNQREKKMFLQRIENALNRGIVAQQVKRETTWGQQIRIRDGFGRLWASRSVNTVPTPDDAIAAITNETLEYYSPRNRNLLQRSLMAALREIVQGNLVYDKVATEQERKTVAGNTPPVIRDILKGDPVVVKGALINKNNLAVIEKYEREVGNRHASINLWRKLTTNTLLSLLLMIVTGIYIYHIHPEVVKSNQKMWLIGMTAILTILINYGFAELFNVVRPIMPVPLPQTLITMVLPIALASVLLSVLIGLRVAVYIGLFASIIAALMLERSFDVVLQGLVVSCLAGFAVRHSSNYRTYFVRMILAISLALAPFALSHLWDAHKSQDMMVWVFIISLSLINGMVTAFIALVLLFIFEAVFQVSTDMTLLTLCDYNHPLLKRLQLEAPGTYHHSLMVSTLAEQAAVEIGANPIKARVGALFHDIGKLSKPEYFTENALDTAESKHKDLHPRMSSLIILNHVKEGVDMALKYKLRKIIRDAIEQHHGTDIVYYFYKQAQEESRDKDSAVGESEYRYPGPLPVEREVTLISLADSCEAASRSLQKPTPAKIDALVWEIFRKRIRSGQLDHANLTFGELSRVRRSFVKTLTTMLHGRIAYPKDEEDNEDDLFVAAERKVSDAAKEKNETTAEKSS